MKWFVPCLKFALVALCLTGSQVLRAHSPDHEGAIDLIKQELTAVDLERVVVISGNMELDPQAAQNFWPLYKNYLADVVAIRDKQLRNLSNYSGLIKSGKISRAAATSLVQTSLDLEQSRMEARQRMIREAIEILTPTQTLLLYQLEITMESQMKGKLLEQIPYAQ